MSQIQESEYSFTMGQLYKLKQQSEEYDHRLKKEQTEIPRSMFRVTFVSDRLCSSQAAMHKLRETRQSVSRRAQNILHSYPPQVDMTTVSFDIIPVRNIQVPVNYMSRIEMWGKERGYVRDSHGLAVELCPRISDEVFDKLGVTTVIPCITPVLCRNILCYFVLRQMNREVVWTLDVEPLRDRVLGNDVAVAFLRAE